MCLFGLRVGGRGPRPEPGAEIVLPYMSDK